VIKRKYGRGIQGLKAFICGPALRYAYKQALLAPNGSLLTLE
jgi:hypothetical protein